MKKLRISRNVKNGKISQSQISGCDQRVKMFRTFWAALLGYLNARTHPTSYPKPSHKVLLPCPPCICRLAVAGVTQTQVPVVRDTTVSHSSQVRKVEKSFPAPGEVCSWCISSAWPRLSMREKAVFSEV